MASWQDQFVQSQHHGLFLPQTLSIQHTPSSSSPISSPLCEQEDQSHEPRPSVDDTEGWKAYWRNKGQPWRTEPMIDPQRQEELAKRRAIVPDIEKGIYPFKEMKLSRADVEWLLATHENGRGPVTWEDESQSEPKGLDLRGADLSQENLSRLPLAYMQGGLLFPGWELATEEQRNMAAVRMEQSDLEGARLQRANLGGAQLQGAFLNEAQLQGANLGGAQLQGAYLRKAQLQGAFLGEAQLQGAFLRGSDLDSAILDVTTQVPGSHAIGKGVPSKTATSAASMERPCLRMVDR